MDNKIEYSKLKEVLDNAGNMGLRVFIEYQSCYETLGHKPTIDELVDFSRLDKNTIVFNLGGLKEMGIIKERTPQEEALDLMLESEFDDLLQRNIDVYISGGCFSSTSAKDLCIQSLKDFTEKKIENNPSKDYIYRNSLVKKLEMISRI